MHVTDRDQLQALFAEHNLRFTRQRAAVYKALCATTSHPTVDELYRTVCADEQDISLATIYNTLEAFCSTGLAQKLPTDGSSCRYDATTHNHLHFRDARSGKVSDVPDELGEMLLKHLPRHILNTIEARMGLRIQDVRIELVGEQQAHA